MDVYIHYFTWMYIYITEGTWIEQVQNDLDMDDDVDMIEIN